RLDFHDPHHLPALHPFPTRRSSDLTAPILRALAGFGFEDIAFLSERYIEQYQDFIERALDSSITLSDIGKTLSKEVPATSSVSSDRKSTRLNSSHLGISYAVFCLKK